MSKVGASSSIALVQDIASPWCKTQHRSSAEVSIARVNMPRGLTIDSSLESYAEEADLDSVEEGEAGGPEANVSPSESEEPVEEKYEQISIFDDFDFNS